jgi:hypothetical protein
VEVVVDGVDPRALLLLDGVNAGATIATMTARVFVYQRNVERLAGSIEHVAAKSARPSSARSARPSWNRTAHSRSRKKRCN